MGCITPTARTACARVRPARRQRDAHMGRLEHRCDVGAGGAVTKYARGIGLISPNDGTNTRFYVYNGHGDVVQLTNGSGAVAWVYDYNAFGVQRDISGQNDDNDPNPFRYCAEYYDTETERVYLRARYYDPGTGRFSAEDPMRDGLNWYTYCGGNPIAFTDPSGLAIIGVREAIEGAGGRVVWNEKCPVTSVADTWNGW